MVGIVFESFAEDSRSFNNSKMSLSCISWSKLIKGIALRNVYNKLMYSASVILKVT